MNFRKKKIFLGFVVILLISITGGIYLFKVHSKSPEQVVKEYTVNLLKAYQSLNFGDVSKYLTSEQYFKDQNHIENLKRDKNFMVARIKRQKVAFKEVKERNAQVKMAEYWVYRLVDYETKKVIEPDREVMYVITYYLKRDLLKGWLITDTEAISYDFGLDRENGDIK